MTGVGLVCATLSVGLPLLVIESRFVSPETADARPGGDDALQELCTWHALHGEQFEGQVAHSKIRNLGPLQFYLMAPLYWIAGCRFAGISLTACAINLGAIAGILLVARREMGRSGVLLAALLLSLYLGSLDVLSIALAWPATVTVLPFLLAVVLFAEVGIGRVRYLPAAIFFSSYLLQTYVAYVPTLLAVGVLSVTFCFLPRLRERVVSATYRPAAVAKVLLVSLGLLLLLWSIPLVHEVVAPRSDVADLVRFFTEHETRRSWLETLTTEAAVVSLFPFGRGSDIREVELSWKSIAVVVAELLLLPVCFCLARREGGPFEAFLALLCAVMLGAFAFSIRWIPGQVFPHMVFWMTGVSMLTLLVAGAVVIRVSARRWPTRGATAWNRVVAGRIVAGIALAALGLSVAGNVSKTCKILPEVREELDCPADLDLLTTASLDHLRGRGITDCRVRIVDHDLWAIAAGFVLQLTKAGVQPSVDADWVPLFGSRYSRRQPPRTILLLCRVESRCRAADPRDLQSLAKTHQVLLLLETPTTADDYP